ncbi:MAG: hypothetical protein R6U95_00940 [Bacteroidales bacterium]
MKYFTSILFSCILLASNMTFAMGIHFCGGKAVESTFLFGETLLGCEMPEKEKSCDIPLKNDTNDVHIDHVPCCENEFKTVQTTHEFVKNAVQFSLDIEFAVAFLYSTFNMELFPHATDQFHIKNNSPPIEKDIQVLFQTFLI